MSGAQLTMIGLGAASMVGVMAAVAHAGTVIGKLVSGPIADRLKNRETLQMLSAGGLATMLGGGGLIASGADGAALALVGGVGIMSVIDAISGTVGRKYGEWLAGPEEGAVARKYQNTQRALASALGRTLGPILQPISDALLFVTAGGAHLVNSLVLRFLPSAPKPEAGEKPSFFAGARLLVQNGFTHGFLWLSLPAVFANTAATVHMVNIVATNESYSFLTKALLLAAISTGIVATNLVPDELIARANVKWTYPASLAALGGLSLVYAGVTDALAFWAASAATGMAQSVQNTKFGDEVARVVPSKYTGSAWSTIDIISAVGGIAGGLTVGSMLSEGASFTGWMNASIFGATSLAASILGYVTRDRKNGPPSAGDGSTERPAPFEPFRLPPHLAALHRDRRSEALLLRNGLEDNIELYRSHYGLDTTVAVGDLITDLLLPGSPTWHFWFTELSEARAALAARYGIPLEDLMENDAVEEELADRREAHDEVAQRFERLHEIMRSVEEARDLQERADEIGASAAALRGLRARFEQGVGSADDIRRLTAQAARTDAVAAQIRQLENFRMQIGQPIDLAASAERAARLRQLREQLHSELAALALDPVGVVKDAVGVTVGPELLRARAEALAARGSAKTEFADLSAELDEPVDLSDLRAERARLHEARALKAAELAVMLDGVSPQQLTPSRIAATPMALLDRNAAARNESLLRLQGLDALLVVLDDFVASDDLVHRIDAAESGIAQIASRRGVASARYTEAHDAHRRRFGDTDIPSVPDYALAAVRASLAAAETAVTQMPGWRAPTVTAATIDDWMAQNLPEASSRLEPAEWILGLGTLHRYLSLVELSRAAVEYHDKDLRSYQAAAQAQRLDTMMARRREITVLRAPVDAEFARLATAFGVASDESARPRALRRAQERARRELEQLVRDSDSAALRNELVEGRLPLHRVSALREMLLPQHAPLRSAATKMIGLGELAEIATRRNELAAMSAQQERNLEDGLAELAGQTSGLVAIEGVSLGSTDFLLSDSDRREPPGNCLPVAGRAAMTAAGVPIPPGLAGFVAGPDGVSAHDAAKLLRADWHPGGFDSFDDIRAHLIANGGAVVAVMAFDGFRNMNVGAHAVAFTLDGDRVVVEEDGRKVDYADWVRPDNVAGIFGLVFNADGTAARPLADGEEPSAMAGVDFADTNIGARPQPSDDAESSAPFSESVEEQLRNSRWDLDELLRVLGLPSSGVVATWAEKRWNLSIAQQEAEVAADRAALANEMGVAPAELEEVTLLLRLEHYRIQRSRRADILGREEALVRLPETLRRYRDAMAAAVRHNDALTTRACAPVVSEILRSRPDGERLDGYDIIRFPDRKMVVVAVAGEHQRALDQLQAQWRGVETELDSAAARIENVYRVEYRTVRVPAERIDLTDPSPAPRHVDDLGVLVQWESEARRGWNDEKRAVGRYWPEFSNDIDAQERLGKYHAEVARDWTLLAEQLRVDPADLFEIPLDMLGNRLGRFHPFFDLGRQLEDFGRRRAELIQRNERLARMSACYSQQLEFLAELDDVASRRGWRSFFRTTPGGDG